MNAIHDVDALSTAVPYCHGIVPDREMASLLSCSGTAPRNGTKIIITLSELPDALLELAEQAGTPGRPNRLQLGGAMGRLLHRLGRPAQERPTEPSAAQRFNLKRQKGKRLV
jgi:hypothetical protein